MNPILRIQQIGKFYGSHEAIQNISFDVQQNEIIAILGPSGCGKTTLLKCLLGLEQPDHGTIEINSQPQDQWLEQHRIAYVPQKYPNFAYLTVDQNIQAANGENDSFERARLLKSVGLHAHRDAYPGKLSGGMQQRLALARALSQATDIIAFDESLNAVDVETRHQMQELLLEQWSEHPKTIVFVTHDIEEALFLSQRVIVMGTAPGVVRDVIHVPFPFPRKSTLRYEESFQQLRRTLSYVIRSEGMKGKHSDHPTTNKAAYHIGLYYWSGNSPLFYAQDQGLFRQRKFPVELQSFTNHRRIIELWKSGALDMINVTMDTALRLQQTYPDTEIFAGLNISQGGDALISRELVNSITDLKGKTIALEKNASSEFFLKYLLYQHGMNLSDVVIQDLPGDAIGAALIHGTVDAAVLWEPWLSKALELSRSSIVATTNDDPVLADVLITTTSFLREHPEVVPQLRSIWSAAVQEFHMHPKEFLRTVAPLVGLSSQDLKHQLQGIQFLDGSTNQVMALKKDIQHLLTPWPDHRIPKKRIVNP